MIVPGPVVGTLSNSSTIFIFESSSCNDLHSCRTIWNIIWSSFFTLFACTWLSVHPNIPAPDDSWGRKATRRVWTMIAVLLAPELLVGWATRQLILASKIAKENKEYGWTKTHGFFVVMGGFMECDKDGRPVGTVTIDKVDTIPDKTKRRILEEDITTRSKGDIFSKSFAIIQTTWFILQCISRTVVGLPVTKLEISTVAFCVLNFATYILWWNKPLNVTHPIRVYADEGRVEKTEGEEAEAEKAAGGEAEAEKAAGGEAEAEKAEGGEAEVEKDSEGHTDTRTGRTWRAAFVRGLADIPKEIFRPLAGMVEDDDYGVAVTIILFPFFLIVTLLNGRSFESNPRRIGTFGPMYEESDWAEIMCAVVGTVFGAIHCTAWMSQFPTDTEQLLWRVAAISVTAVPLFIAVVVWVDPDITIVKVFVYFTFIAAGCLYILARLALLVLPLMSLRSLPSGSFASVSWTRFIPHI